MDRGQACDVGTLVQVGIDSILTPNKEETLKTSKLTILGTSRHRRRVISKDNKTLRIYVSSGTVS
jgi:hypothetical protein